ncbi:LysR family transcriptional regulator [Asaia prunellae]|uniref:LysR family transcriptional regulator n=1 Tax=Asaia prunellae TaxID=610245 RepID=UPI00046F61C5|nr:LysR family transcriptional regulator [Asaia prunellae]
MTNGLAIPELNLRHIRALIIAAQENSLSAAALAVDLSQPALTQGIGSIETKLAVRIFDRLPHGLRLTREGEQIVIRFRRALDYLGEGLKNGAAISRRQARPEHHLTLVQVKALLLLSETGGIAAAARMGELSKPAILRPLKALETLSQIELLEKNGRILTLSRAGHRMARKFRLGINELVIACREAARQTDHISIGAMALARSMLLPVALAELARTTPLAQMNVVDGSARELFSALRNGVLDLVIGALREEPPPELRQELLLRDRIAVIGRVGHPLAGHRPSLDELARYPWIVGPRTSYLLDQWQQIFDRAGIERPKAPIQCASVTTIRGVLTRSDFLTLLSRDQIAIEMSAGLLTPIESEIPDTIRTIGVFTRRDWLPSALQERFLTQLRMSARTLHMERS